jgi:four helix bundle suffix protein
MNHGFIPPHGGYRGLLCFNKARIIYFGTVRFCRRFIDKYDRTRDQMIQAARSGKQNILEGSQASGISKETEIKLIGIARASLEELLEDYLDYLTVENLSTWPKDSPKALFVRRLGREPNESYRTYFDTRSGEVVANIMICLIHQTNYLLDQLIRKLEETIVNEGGLRERMSRARSARRTRSRG